ncbi:PiggyBac transposable element-derived protein 3, partial [Stegodyphus mimosarum]
MLQPVIDPNSHIIFLMIFFNSYDLLVELKTQGFRAMGTIRNNRTASYPLMPDKILEKKNRGTYDYCFDKRNEIIIVKWKDNKCVTTATNFDYIEPLTQLSRHQKGLKEKS